MSRIFRTMYQVPDLGTGVEERERPWRLTLEALRHPEREEELLQQAIPPAKQTSTNSFQTPSQARRSQQALAGAAGPAPALVTPRHFAFLRDESFQLVRRLFLAAGARSAEVAPHALVTSGRLAARISELAAGFGYVLLDAPPGLGNRVTSCLAALADGVILLVQPSFTPRQAARQAKENIEATGGRL